MLAYLLFDKIGIGLPKAMKRYVCNVDGYIFGTKVFAGRHDVNFRALT